MDRQLLIFLILISPLIFPACKKVDKEIPVPNFAAGVAADNILNIDKAIADSMNITAYLEMYTGDAPIANATVLQKELWQKCADSLSPGIFTQKPIRWFRFTLRNNTAQPFRALFCFKDFDYVALDYFSTHVQKAGTLAPLKEWSYFSDNHCLVLYLNAAQTKTFYLRCDKGTSVNKHPVSFLLRSEQNEESFQAFEIRERMLDTVFLFFYLGFLFFCFIYFLAQFLYRSNEKVLIVYALYILFTLLYSFRDIDKHFFLQTAFPAFNGIKIWGEAIFSYLSYIFYLLFVIYLLDLKKERKWAFRLIVSAISLISILLFLDAILRLSGSHQSALILFVKSRMLLFPFTILSFILMLPFNGSYYKYFVFGLVFLVVGTGINLLVYVLRDHPEFIFYDAVSSKYGFWGNPVNYTRLGVIMEILFFSLGLAKKMRVEFAEAVLKQDNVIDNEFYTHEIKSGLYTLEDKLSAHSEAANFMVIYLDFLEKTLETMKSRTEVELNKEIAMAEAHFKLRQQNNHRFEFNFENNTGLETNKIFFPPGLLIPFIQNFFEHGIDDDHDKYQFNLLLYLDGKRINLDITDNGKGFETADIFNKPGSVGLTNAREKINIYNTFTGSKIDFSIGNNKTARGALITITNLKKIK